MRSEAELDRSDYHLRLMIERMQRDDSSEVAIEKAIRNAVRCKPRTKMPGTSTNRRSHS
jgi:hypothetical protein